MRSRLVPIVVLLFMPALAALKPDILQSTGAIPANIAGRFREAAGFQQSASGRYFVFDRRAHAVFGVDEGQTSSWEVVRIGAEAGRMIDPTRHRDFRAGTMVFGG